MRLPGKTPHKHEIVFIPQKVADRLREYAMQVCESPDDRIFPISYEAARAMVNKAGKMVGNHLRHHDLRRHSAIYASRSGVPIEIVSKIILSDMPIFRPPSAIWARSVLLRLLDGLKISMANTLEWVIFIGVTPESQTLRSLIATSNADYRWYGQLFSIGKNLPTIADAPGFLVDHFFVISMLSII